jgi:hypothetical protein
MLRGLERMLAIVEAKIGRDRKMMEQAIDMLDRSLRRLRKEYEAPPPYSIVLTTRLSIDLSEHLLHDVDTSP